MAKSIDVSDLDIYYGAFKAVDGVDITVDRNGLVHAPQGPGLGAKIDFERIERMKQGVLR